MKRIAILALVAILCGGASAFAQPAKAAKDAGWTSLFDGKSLAGWRAFKSETPPPGWEVKDGVLVHSGTGGDLMTVGEYGSFELELDYKIAKLTALFEPLVIIVMGLIVGFVAVALVSAMYGIFRQVKV